MLTLKGRADFTEGIGNQYDTCVICGPVKVRAITHFDSGSVAPIVGETITGATSADTGVVEYITLVSGTYAGGDAVGVMTLTSPTGYSLDDSVIFQNDENLNGSNAGNNFATVNGACGINRSGRMYPDQELVDYEGQKYCRAHFDWRFKKAFEDEQDIDTRETERGK